MAVLISIDGACRRNGKPDCVSAGGVFIQYGHYTECLSVSEESSTNQRGEIHALIAALEWCKYNVANDVRIVTDSEYLFNTMTREWYKGWESRNWQTASYEPLKNADLWKIISEHRFTDINYYHIKGHCIPFGRVTADTLLKEDPSGASLLQAVNKKYDDLSGGKLQSVAQALSIKNNGFELSEEALKSFVVANTVADAIATKCVDAADAQRK